MSGDEKRALPDVNVASVMLPKGIVGGVERRGQESSGPRRRSPARQRADSDSPSERGFGLIDATRPALGVFPASLFTPT